MSPAAPAVNRFEPFEKYAEASLPTSHGTFRTIVYRDRATGVEHVALVKGEVEHAKDVLVRVHSECITGEVFHSLKCDCRQQLDAALEELGKADAGVVVYLRQEGRGIGLGNKIRAYALQERGADTVDANRMLGFPDDARRYDAATFMLTDLGVKRVRLITNNPLKAKALRAAGIAVTERVPSRVEPNPVNRGYLETKRARMGHAIDAVDVDPVDANDD